MVTVLQCVMSVSVLSLYITNWWTVKFHDEHQVYGIAGTLHKILGEEIILENVMGFLKDIGLFYDI